MIAHGIQLLCSIKYYRKSMNDMYDDLFNTVRSSSAPQAYEIVPKSAQYPANIFGYLFGSFVIFFNLILFILSMFVEIITRLTSFTWLFIFILPTIVAYFLHKRCAELINIFFTRQHSNDEDNLRVNRPYSILMYFNLISSKRILFLFLNFRI